MTNVPLITNVDPNALPSEFNTLIEQINLIASQISTPSTSVVQTTVALLNTNYPAANYTPGTRASVTDSTLSLVEGLGQIATGGGAMWTPVTADNAGNWRIG